MDHLARLEREATSSKAEEYHVVYRVLNAADFGVPQRRERIIFVGFRNNLSVRWSFPNPTHSADRLLWDQVRSEIYWDRHRVAVDDRNTDCRHHAKAMAMIEKPRLKAWRTVRDALKDLPDPEFFPEKATAFDNHNFQAGARSYPGHTGSPLTNPRRR